MNHISHVLSFVQKTYQNPNPGDALLRAISLAARDPSHKSKKLDTIFNMQTIEYFSFQGFHAVCFSFLGVGALSLIN